jgi:small conductance mechanosensitive channel
MDIKSIIDYFSANLLAPLLRVGVILLLTLAALRAVTIVRRRLKQRIEGPTVALEQRARLTTLLMAGVNLARIVILGIATLMVLVAIGINITPLLASVGVVSLALSLGAQTLIKDFIGGTLILIENQFSVGDAVQIGFDPETAGTVEQITLRSTYIRDPEGKLVIVPNGEVRVVLNSSNQWARAIVDINVPFDEDLRKAIQVLEAAMQVASQDETIKPFLSEAPQITGWNSFTEWAVQVRIAVKTTPDKRVTIANALRRYAQEALRKAGIEIAVRRI